MSVENDSPAAVSVSRKLQALRCADCFPVPARSVELIETHFAWVFLVGDYAYKMKKPAAYPLLDLRSLADRYRNCQQELRLNRRLAPDVYLDVVPLSLTKDGALRVGAEGCVVDWLVWMKRLPAASMLDRAIAARTTTPAALTAIGELLAQFYERQQRYFFPPHQYLSRLLERTAAEGRALLAPELMLNAARVNSAVSAVQSCMRALHGELGSRALEGRVRECHGDLRPEHICLAPPCVIDSLEFSHELRVLDPVEELAFLRLECQVAGAPEVAEQVVEGYRQRSGDLFSRQLLDCYLGRRALVRAKIVAWHVLDPEVAALAPWSEQARAYIELAERSAGAASTTAS